MVLDASNAIVLEEYTAMDISLKESGALSLIVLNSYLIPIYIIGVNLVVFLTQVN